MNETTILDDGKVRVTTGSFEAGTKVYDLSDITSARVESVLPNLAPVFALGVIALVLCWFGLTGLMLGLVVAVAAVGFWATRVPTFSVVLFYKGDLEHAFSGTSFEHASRIVNALDQLLTARNSQPG